MPRRLSIAPEIELTGDRAAFLPAHGALVIADVHVGYARAARRRGGWLPRGEDASATAERALVAARAASATQLVIAGDLRHSTRDVDEGELAEVRDFLARLAAELEVTVVPGNHDLGATRYADLSVTLASALRLGDVDIVHEPPRAPPDRWTICGHLHPVTTVRDETGAGARYACALVGPRTIILPAFGDWPGGTSASRLVSALPQGEWKRFPMSGGEVYGQGFQP